MKNDDSDCGSKGVSLPASCRYATILRRTGELSSEYSSAKSVIGTFVCFLVQTSGQSQNSLLGIVEIPAENADITKKPKKIRSYGRNPLPDNLPVEIIEIQPAPEDLICQPCGSEKQQIGETICEELDYKPGSIFVRKFVRGIYACPQKCEGQVTVAENVGGSIEKELPGAGLLARVVPSKYADHLPLSRQKNILARHGVSIPRTTFCDWTAAAAYNLRSFRDLLRDEVLNFYVIHTDDTPVDVNDPKGKNKPHKGRIRIYHGDRNPYILYDLSPNRSSEWPKQLLFGWQGILLTDVYTGYKKIHSWPNP